jgi:predicted metal-dependent phosphoesterase TrpH
MPNRVVGSLLKRAYYSESPMRCDIHIHSRHSGRTTLPVLRHVARDSYSQPGAILETARQRGMDLVTITDHDSIAGALEIAHEPGVFLSEEITCRFPSGRVFHISVLGITERQHQQIARLRDDAEALLAFLEQERALAILNHPFSPVIGPREPQDLKLGLSRLRHVETLNGMMPAPANRAAETAGADSGLGAVGGSDAHTLSGVGRAWTEVPGARTADDFLEGLRAGHGIVRGTSAGWGRLTAAIASTAVSTYRESASLARDDARAALRLAALVLSTPLMAAIPLVTAAVHLRERVLSRAYERRYRRWISATQAAAPVIGEQQAG